MTNAVVTWASGESFCYSDGFRSYIGSLCNIKDSDFFVFTSDMPNDVRSSLKEQGIHVVDFPSDQIRYILRDRHLAYFNWLSQKSEDYDLFLFTDSKDIVFQTNPFDHWNTKPVMLVCEGMEHKQSLWNLNDQSQVQLDVREFRLPIQERPVLNGGVIMGKGTCLKYHFFIIWSNTLKSIGSCTDQGVLNFLYNWLEYNPDYSITDPRKDNFCLTGEAVKERWVQVVFENGLYKNLQGDTFSIIHQYDRLPQSPIVMERYTNGT